MLTGPDQCDTSQIEPQEIDVLMSKSVDDLTIAEGIKILEHIRSWKARKRLHEESGEYTEPNTMRTNDGNTLKFTEV